VFSNGQPGLLALLLEPAPGELAPPRQATLTAVEHLEHERHANCVDDGVGDCDS
jgi:hypothetical protein